MRAQPQLLRLLHLASPALPIGGFHFSQGLEYAVEAGWVRDEATALDWICGLLEHSVATLDLPVLARLHRCLQAGDLAAYGLWNALLTATRETEELRAEDRHLGTALTRVLADLSVPLPDTGKIGRSCSYAAAFAAACSHWQIGESATVQAYGWVWTETQTLAAIKLVPLGQSAGQRILHLLIPRLSDICRQAQSLTDEQIGVSSVMQTVASARHETQYTRLFRS